MHFPILTHDLTLIIDYKMGVELCCGQTLLLDVLGQNSVAMSIFESTEVSSKGVKILLEAT